VDLEQGSSDGAQLHKLGNNAPVCIRTKIEALEHLSIVQQNWDGNRFLIIFIQILHGLGFYLKNGNFLTKAEVGHSE
jgi:hypothetical protein